MFDPKDYDGESNERDERDRRARSEADEDARDERYAAMLAEANVAIEEAVDGWVRAVTATGRKA